MNIVKNIISNRFYSSSRVITFKTRCQNGLCRADSNEKISFPDDLKSLENIECCSRLYNLKTLDINKVDSADLNSLIFLRYNMRYFLNIRSCYWYKKLYQTLDEKLNR